MWRTRRLKLVAIVLFVLAACAPTFPAGSTLTVLPTGSGAKIVWPAASGSIGLYRIDVDGIEVTRLASPSRSCTLSGLTSGPHQVVVTAYNVTGEWSGSVASNGSVAGSVTPPTPAAPGSAIRCVATSSLVRVPDGGFNINRSPLVSGDGRYVTFTSPGALVPGDSDGVVDVFLWQRSTGQTTAVSTGTAPSVATGISADGRYISFTQLFFGVNTTQKQMIWDRLSNTTRQVTVSGGGELASLTGYSMTNNGRQLLSTSDGVHLLVDPATGSGTPLEIAQSGNPNLYPKPFGLLQISGSGNYIVFHGTQYDPTTLTDRPGLFGFVLNDAGPNLAVRLPVPDGASLPSISDDGTKIQYTLGNDLYMLNRTAGTSARITMGDFKSDRAVISGDGRHVAFESRATNLISGVTNATTNIYLWDEANGQLQALANTTDYSGSGKPTISDDGGIVAFESIAPDLVPGDGPNSIDPFVWSRLPD